MKEKTTLKKICIVIIMTLISLMISYAICEPKMFSNQLSLQEKLHNRLFITIFIGYTAFLIIAWYGIISLIKKIKDKDKNALVFIKHFAIYFGIMFIFLLLMWPGHWVWDEIYILNPTCAYEVFTWQSVITQIYYAIALLIFPNIVSIVILQITLISLVIAYIQMEIEIIYENKYFNIVMYLLFLMPAFIINNLYVLRLQMYSYCMLLFFAILIFNYIEKKDISIKQLFLLFLLSVIILLWRSEGVIFIVFIPILMALNYKDVKKALQVALVFFTILAITYIGFNKAFEKYENKNYALLIYVNPLSNMLQENININEEDIENINKIMDVQVLKDNPSYTETPSYWDGDLIRGTYSDSDLSNFKKTYIKLVLKNPLSFLKARMKTFMATSGLESGFSAQGSNNFLQVLSGVDENDVIEKFCNKYNFKTIFTNTKVKLEAFLIGENIEDGTQNYWMKVIFWNFIPMVIATLIIGIINLYKRNWIYTFICITLLAKTAVVFLTAPASYFMYYLPEYAVGIMLVCISIYEKIRKKGELNDRVIKEK